MRMDYSTKRYSLDATPAILQDGEPIAAALDDVYLLLSRLLLDGTAAQESTRIRRALAQFVNAYSNPDGASPDVTQTRLFQAWIASCGALGIKPVHRTPDGEKGGA